MKTSIKAMLDCFVHDNASFIQGGNVAEYILADAQSATFGYFWFLNDEEITEFEQNRDMGKAYIEEIISYVHKYYNYFL